MKLPTEAEKLAAYGETMRLREVEATKNEAGIGCSQEDKKTKTQAGMLIELANNIELFKTPNNDPYATISVEAHKETYSVISANFKRWLIGRFYNVHKKSPSNNAVTDALNTFAAKACYEGNQKDIHIRIAEANGNIYLDLANDKWEVVEITPQSWQVLADSPVKFIRPRGMLALPYPVAGGSIEELKQCINYPNEDGFKLIVAWLVASLRPNRPFPILTLQGEQGSAKSTAAKILRSLIDPNSANVRSLSRNEQDLVIAANNGWILNFDNLSNLTNWMSDALCRLSTGGGFAVRQLYTDKEEVLFDAKRPVILNGIDDIATRQDLIDRALVLTLPTIAEEKRQSEAMVWERVEDIKPKVLGVLLDAVSMALKRVANIELSGMPRMADFAVWVTAAETAFGWSEGSFLQAYTGNRSEAIEIGLEADPVAIAVRDLMKDKEAWQGSATSLLEELTNRTNENVAKSRAWPKAANKLSSRIRRLANGLRAIGVEVDYGKDKKRFIELKRKPPKPTVSIISTVGNSKKDQVKPLFTTDDKPTNDQLFRRQQNSISGAIKDSTDSTDDKKQDLLINQESEEWEGAVL